MLDFLKDWMLMKPGVYHAPRWGECLNENTIDKLIDLAAATPNQLARLCLHPSPDCMEHQMLIAMSRTAPYPIHCHPAKNEAVLPVLGEALHLTYDADGLVVSENRLGRGSSIYLSTLAGVWHSMNAVTDWFVYWEMAPGPFDPSSTMHAPWTSD